MISIEELDAYLEIWAREKLGDNAAYRRLWYPNSTPEHRFALRGGAAPSPAIISPVSGIPDAFEKIDKAMSQLLRSRPTIWYKVISEWLLNPAPNEIRARKLNLESGRFKTILNSTRRYLRDILDEDNNEDR